MVIVVGIGAAVAGAIDGVVAGDGACVVIGTGVNRALGVVVVEET